ncbi:lipopolysaccharide biosynthesis protein [Paraburkholderia sp. BCC1886]|uniref:lipopolysaccharide biosynthesis protein n=1 Tax=Paraburkholderia sp. BCC1886 TaxID=2562670 RepID=UPI001181D074|nr:polysaccharide biosynthesis protein [Paraburkholderia sp. BCC1886]
MQLFVRFALRVVSLALKFALTLVLARQLGFAAVADYGLALAVSVISSKVLGLGFSTEINRRLSAPQPASAIRDAGRLLLLYGVVYGVLALLVFIVYRSGEFEFLRRILPAMLASVVLVAFSEHAALETTAYVFSLHRSRTGALLLFIRTGVWAGVAILGLYAGWVQRVETVLTLWWGANVVAVCVAYACVRRCARDADAAGVIATGKKAGSIRSVWLDGLPFLVAGTVLAALQYGERFLASGAMSADALGRYVFAWSIANAIQTIAYVTVSVTAGPRLVRALSASLPRSLYQPQTDFWQVLRGSVRAGGGVALAVGVAILLAHTLIFRVAHEPAGPAELAMLSTLLISFVLRSVADVLWAAAIALRLGRQVAIALGGVVFVMLPLGWVSIQQFGAMGAALAHVGASLGIAIVLAMVLLRARVTLAGGEVLRAS